MNDSGFAYDKIYNTLADLCKKQCYLTNEKEKIKSEYDEKLIFLYALRVLMNIDPPEVISQVLR